MPGQADFPAALTASLEERWRDLCSRHLPVGSDDSIWRFSRTGKREDPVQGWKLHVSATVLSACAVFERIGPLLTEAGALYKAPASLAELMRMNCGLFYGMSQVGKFVTIYPENAHDAVALAHELHERTRRFPGPVVPYDRPFRRGSRVHYRFGSFSLEMVEGDSVVSAIRTPDGTLTPDLRLPGSAVPSWQEDPFAVPGEPLPAKPDNGPLRSIRAFKALSQRGKGGVYRALDLSVSPARVCILKEGRRDGETDWDGRDGWWRVGHEAVVLQSLRRAGVPVPSVLKTFEVDSSRYLAMESVEGTNLQRLVLRWRKLPRRERLCRALSYGIRVAKIVERIHSAGWVWRDLKPLNLIATGDGEIRPVDFEGACPIDEPDPMPWGTAGYVPPGWPIESVGRGVPEDIYALGATLFHLLGERPPSPSRLPRLRRLRRFIPREISDLVDAMTDPSPTASRPRLDEVRRVLELALDAHAAR